MSCAGSDFVRNADRRRRSAGRRRSTPITQVINRRPGAAHALRPDVPRDLEADPAEVPCEGSAPALIPGADALAQDLANFLAPSDRGPPHAVLELPSMPSGGRRSRPSPVGGDRARQRGEPRPWSFAGRRAEERAGRGQGGSTTPSSCRRIWLRSRPQACVTRDAGRGFPVAGPESGDRPGRRTRFARSLRSTWRAASHVPLAACLEHGGNHFAVAYGRITGRSWSAVRSTARLWIF